MSDPACPSCGTPYDNHLSLHGTCAALLEARRERDEARAEIDEARAALAAEQGKSEGAPSDGWCFGSDGWYNGEYVVIVDEVRQQRRAYYWGRCGTHAWKLAPCDHFRAGMLAADRDRSTIANATISEPPPTTEGSKP